MVKVIQLKVKIFLDGIFQLSLTLSVGYKRKLFFSIKYVDMHGVLIRHLKTGRQTAK